MDNAQLGRILLVVPEGADDFTASFLERLDHPVTTCHGPTPGAACPMVLGEGCPWYDTAHGIVFSLDLARPAHRAVLRAYAETARSAGREIPMRVVVSAGPQPPPDVDDVVAWAGEPSVADLDGFAALVEAADRFA